MFLGHFAAGFAGKAAARRVSLGSLFLASQFVDLLWPTLLLLGVERVAIAPGATTVTPLLFEHYPISHSLLGVLIWGVVVGGLHFAGRRNAIGALILGSLVVSHWLLDAIVHQPDLPLLPGESVLIGLNAWSSLPLTLVIEVGLLAAGVWLYARTTRAVNRRGRWGLVSLVAFLVVVYAANVLGEPPPDETAIAWVGQAQWILILWAYRVDMHRAAATHGGASEPDQAAPEATENSYL